MKYSATLFALLPILASCVSNNNFRRSALPFVEEGPTPPLMASEEETSQDVTPVTRDAFPLSHEYSPMVMNDSEVVFVSDFNGDYDIFAFDFASANPAGQSELVRTESNEKAPFVGAIKTADGGLETRCVYVSDANFGYGIFSGELPRVQIQTSVFQPSLDANWPAIDPSGERLLFSSLDRQGEYQVWLQDKDGVKLVANGQRACWNPAEPNRIAYTALSGATWQIYEKDVDDGSVRQLTAGMADNFDPQYSPDGESIAFTSNRGGSSDIMIMDADGTNSRTLTKHGAADCQPAWSPNGEWILFASNRAETWDIWKIRSGVAAADSAETP